MRFSAVFRGALFFGILQVLGFVDVVPSVPMLHVASAAAGPAVQVVRCPYDFHLGGPVVAPTVPQKDVDKAAETYSLFALLTLYVNSDQHQQKSIRAMYEALMLVKRGVGSARIKEDVRANLRVFITVLQQPSTYYICRNEIVELKVLQEELFPTPAAPSSGGSP